MQGVVSFDSVFFMIPINIFCFTFFSIVHTAVHDTNLVPGVKFCYSTK